MKKTKSIRNMIVVLGDQLNDDVAALDDFDPRRDAVWMAEVREEATHVWSHKARIALFLSAMRHFRQRCEKRGFAVHYQQLDDGNAAKNLKQALERSIKKLKPEKLVLTEPGDYRVRENLQAAAEQNNVPLEIRPDRHFLCSIDEFAEYAKGKKELRLEYFYRHLRKKHGVLMDNGEPAGGKWNYDAENRDSFGKTGPPAISPPMQFNPDDITQDVLDLVYDRFSDHPGSLEHFSWPVTPSEAKRALTDFVKKRLPTFGKYQDAMWIDEPFLYHSRLSAALNLKLLDPGTVIETAEEAYAKGDAPLPAVEGFVRQILGWREYVRGIYWMYMPEYLQRNALEAHNDLPKFYWTADTDYNCLKQAIGQTFEYGYAHHIQRLMVTGLFALLLGVEPKQIHEWYLAVYTDAVEWVELPNVLGMSQYADGGLMASKPYAATGKYIKRMSNYCDACRYDPGKATGEDACPFTTLYWDFLQRHEDKLKNNQRMRLQVRNLSRKSEDELKEIRKQARRVTKEACG